MTPKQIGAAMRKARGERSIRSVAEAAGISRHQVTSIEQALTDYTMPTFLKLAKVVGLRIELSTETKKPCPLRHPRPYRS